MIVNLKGTGQLNGSVIIDKVLDLDDNIARALLGQRKDEVLHEIMNTHFPGVKYKPNQIGVNIVSNKKPKNETNSTDFMKGAVAGAIVASAVPKKSRKNSTKHIDNSGFRKDLEYLLDIPFSDSKSELESQLDTIFISLNAYKWPFSSDNSEIDINNTRIMNQVYEKYKIGHKKLRKLVNESDEIQEHIKQFKKLRIKKFFNRYWLWIYLVGFIIIAFLILSVIS